MTRAIRCWSAALFPVTRRRNRAAQGFPAPTGQSGVWRIEPGATGVRCGVDPGCTRALDGFTSIVDLTLGPDGRQYVSELDERSWAAWSFSGW